MVKDLNVQLDGSLTRNVMSCNSSALMKKEQSCFYSLKYINIFVAFL